MTALIVVAAVAALAAGASGLWWAGLDRNQSVSVTALAAAAGPAIPPSPTTATPTRGSAGPTLVGSSIPASPSRAATSRSAASSRPAATPKSTLIPTTIAPTPGVPPTHATRRPVAVSVAVVTGTAATQDWAGVVRRLDSARARALISRNPLLLDAVYTKGSKARTNDLAVIAQMVAAGITVSGADHRLESAVVLSGHPVRVLVKDSLPAYAILDVTGQVIGNTSSRSTATRVLLLVPTGDGYRIEQVEDV